jgi:hypothetical protein
MTLDSVAGNVQALDRVLATVRQMTGLKPFLRFELALAHGPVPVAQVMCGDVSLEFLEHARGQHPPGTGRIRSVLIEIPGRGPEERELEPGLWLAVRPGPRRRVAEIQVESGAMKEDLDVLRGACGAGPVANGAGGESRLELGNTALCFSALPGPTPPLMADAGQRLPGWHRIGLACRRLEEAASALVQAGGRVEVPPYQVLPGLREAMLRLPSGLVVQPVEQKLWQMLPAVGAQALACKLTGRPLRFSTREV